MITLEIDVDAKCLANSKGFGIRGQIDHGPTQITLGFGNQLEDLIPFEFSAGVFQTISKYCYYSLVIGTLMTAVITGCRGLAF